MAYHPKLSRAIVQVSEKLQNLISIKKITARDHRRSGLLEVLQQENDLTFRSCLSEVSEQQFIFFLFLYNFELD